MKKFTLFVFILISVFAKAQEGFPDPSYGNGGYVATIFNEPSVANNLFLQRSVVLDNNGRLVGAIVVNRVVILVTIKLIKASR